MTEEKRDVDCSAGWADMVGLGVGLGGGWGTEGVKEMEGMSLEKRVYASVRLKLGCA